MNTTKAEGKKGTNIYLVPVIFQALEDTYVLSIFTYVLHSLALREILLFPFYWLGD